MQKASKIIYCDGSSLGNPGRGGFGVVALDTHKKKVWEFGEKFEGVTNNQMELAACLFSLQLILKSFENDKKNNTYEMRLDSKYVIQGVTEWSKNWIKNNWKNAQKKEVANKETWKKILGLISEIEIKKIKILWTHVYGHTGEFWNERVDEIARSVAGGEQVVLRKGESYN